MKVLDFNLWLDKCKFKKDAEEKKTTICLPSPKTDE